MKTTNKDKQKVLIDSVLVVTCLSVVLGLAGCQKEGTAEKAGKKIDSAAENVEQKVEQTTEKVGKELEGAKESVTEKTGTAGEYIDDSVITAKVKAAILNDPLLSTSHIEVTTDKGVVKLSGTVDSEPSIGRAMEVAGSQKNVKSVQTDLTVNASIPSK